MKKLPKKTNTIEWCPWAGSNCRPLPYQGSALPLSHMGMTALQLHKNLCRNRQTDNGAGDGNRTRVISLEGWGSTIELLPHLAFRPDADPQSARHQFRWWRRLDSNQRRRKPTDLQSAPFSHSGTPPASLKLCHGFLTKGKPVDGFFTTFAQPAVHSPEMSTADERGRRAASRQWRGMIRHQDQVIWTLDPCLFGLGMRAPE